MTWQRTPELEESILIALSAGVGLARWCAQGDRPSPDTVTRWMHSDSEFAAKCALSREIAGELSADEQNEIANDCLAGVVTPDVARVVISAKQWRASKLASKKYGDKIDHNVGGEAKFTIEIVKLGTPLIEA